MHLPSLDLPRLAQYFRASMVAFFLRRSLINERLAKSMLGWTHSGFSEHVGEDPCRLLAHP